MTTTFIISTILELAAIILVLFGFAYEDKVIDFEDRCKDRIARRIAHFILTSRLTKNMVRKSPAVVQKRAETNYICARKTNTPTRTNNNRAGRVA